MPLVVARRGLQAHNDDFILCCHPKMWNRYSIHVKICIEGYRMLIIHNFEPSERFRLPKTSKFGSTSAEPQAQIMVHISFAVSFTIVLLSLIPSATWYLSSWATACRGYRRLSLSSFRRRPPALHCCQVNSIAGNVIRSLIFTLNSKIPSSDPAKLSSR